MVKQCIGICNRYKSEFVKRPIYDNHRRCTKCEVYYSIDKVTCPCCKIITRSKPHSKTNRERYINKEYDVKLCKL